MAAVLGAGTSTLVHPCCLWGPSLTGPSFPGAEGSKGFAGPPYCLPNPIPSRLPFSSSRKTPPSSSETPTPTSSFPQSPAQHSRGFQLLYCLPFLGDPSPGWKQPQGQCREPTRDTLHGICLLSPSKNGTFLLQNSTSLMHTWASSALGPPSPPVPHMVIIALSCANSGNALGPGQDFWSLTGCLFFWALAHSSFCFLLNPWKALLLSYFSKYLIAHLLCTRHNYRREQKSFLLS